ncbi:MAG: MerR family transcriptional regulator [Oscillospiraceae bacterium]|nr:MerR family transcriptional regulator [Oscillospiraceae bacterium]
MTIAEVSRKYELSPDTLRYYERIGLIPPVPRTKGGFRDYNEESCGWIELMKCLRAAGVHIDALIEYVKLFHQGSETIEARKALLLEQRELLAARMEEMRQSLERLDHKIATYDQHFAEKERQLRQAQTDEIP